MLSPTYLQGMYSSPKDAILSITFSCSLISFRIYCEAGSHNNKLILQKREFYPIDSILSFFSTALRSESSSFCSLFYISLLLKSLYIEGRDLHEMKYMATAVGSGFLILSALYRSLMPIQSNYFSDNRLDRIGAVVVSSTRIQDLPQLFFGRLLID